MKRIIRLTESDLTRIVRRVIKEQQNNKVNVKLGKFSTDANGSKIYYVTIDVVDAQNKVIKSEPNVAYSCATKSVTKKGSPYTEYSNEIQSFFNGNYQTLCQ